ncbi:ankyrin repeat-containing domain protein [Aspergillus crustosus]
MWDHMSVIGAIVDYMIHAECKDDLPMTIDSVLFSLAHRYRHRYRHGLIWGDDRHNLIRRLLSLGANPYTEMEMLFGNYTLLGWATFRGDLPMVRCFLEYAPDADPERRPSSMTILNAIIGNIAVHRRKDVEVESLLLSELEARGILNLGLDQATLLRCAAACGSENVAQELLRAGCHPDANNSATLKLITALEWAVVYGQEKLARLLLEQGANPNGNRSSDNPQTGALFFAFKYKASLPVAKMLLDAGAGMYKPGCCHEEEESWSGWTHCPVHSLFSLAAEQEDFLRLLLLERYSGPRALNISQVAMEDALASGLPQVQMLLEQGVSLARPTSGNNLPTEDSWNFRLLDAATKGGIATLEFLFNHGYKYSRPNDDSDDKDSGYVFYIYSHGPNVFFARAVSIAVEARDLSALEFLLNHGVKLPRCQN